MASPPSFHDLPEDLQIAVLSFLSPSDLHPFSAASRRSLALCSHPKLWLSFCLRRFGSLTSVRTWPSPSVDLYRTLTICDRLVGFWRQTARSNRDYPPLVLFEWGSSSVVGSRIVPSEGYGVVKVPFLWLGVDDSGPQEGSLRGRGRFGGGLSVGLTKPGSKLDLADRELVSVELSFVGESHFVLVERNGEGSGPEEELELVGLESSSPPESLVLEVYQYFANRTSPGSDKSSRKQRRKERGRKRWEPKHYIRIVDCYPTPSRPLQGIWKGFYENWKLGFFFVQYHKSGVISCHSVLDPMEPSAGGIDPIFWTADTSFNEIAFVGEEVDTYDSFTHAQPDTLDEAMTERVVTKILGIGSACDMVTPVLFGPPSNFDDIEGRLWQYKGGTFGFAYFGSGCIIDLKPVALNGQLLDVAEHYEDMSSS